MNTNKFNVGVPTGRANNLVLLDVDVKDDGFKEYLKYTSQHGTPNTFTVEAPSGGLHLYFRFSESYPESNGVVARYLKNKTKYRGVGLESEVTVVMSQRHGLL